MSVCLSVQAITFEAVDTKTPFLVWWYILTIRRSSSSVKITGSRSHVENCLFGYLDIHLIWFCMSEVKAISRSRSYQGQIVVWLSIGRQEVGLRLKSILVLFVHPVALQSTLYSVHIKVKMSEWNFSPNYTFYFWLTILFTYLSPCFRQFPSSKSHL